MRDAVAQAKNAEQVAGTTAGTYGSAAGGVAANLVPYATRQLSNPSGESQQDIGAQLTAGLAGAGGATSGLTGAANKEMGTTRNPMGFSAALDAAARQRDKTAARVGENVAAKNADVKLNQQGDAAKILSGVYGTDVGAQLAAQRNQTADINSEVDASKVGWQQNAMDWINTLTGASKAMRSPGAG